jgi:hypothetical protein
MTRKFVIEIHPDVIRMKEPLTDLLIEWRVTFLNDLMHRLHMKLLQYLACLVTCSGPVADFILRLQLKFGHGLT